MESSLFNKVKEMHRQNKLFADGNTLSEAVTHIHDMDKQLQIGKMLLSSKENPPKDMQQFTCALLSSFNADALQAFMAFSAVPSRIFLNIYTSSYNQYVYEMLNNDSGFYMHQPQMTILLLDESVIIDKLPDVWKVSDLQQAMDDFLILIKSLLNNFTRKNSGHIILNTVCLSQAYYHYFIAYADRAKLSRKWREFNVELLGLMNEYEQLIVLDTDILLQSIPQAGINDIRLAYYAKMKFHDGLLLEFAKEATAIIRAKLGLTKKALALDLDNTLWGGVLAESSLQAIELGGTPEGEVYVEFQRYIKNLSAQGVLLAINSKNHADNIDPVFSEHSNMLLKDSDFLVKKINWEAKSENMLAIAKQLNIGQDSLVFIDDSDFECRLVKKFVAGADVIHITEPPYNSLKLLQAHRSFNALALTVQDSTRVDSYKADIERRSLLESHTSIADYLNALEIQVKLTIPAVKSIELARVAQLFARTNQFNLTGCRYSEQELTQYCQLPNYLVIAIHTSDKFGDNGIVGAMVLEQLDSPMSLCIRNFVLSCRVFSRNIEQRALQQVVLFSQATNSWDIYAEYISSSKNHQVSDFYLKNGFSLIDSDDTKKYYCYYVNNNFQQQKTIDLKESWQWYCTRTLNIT